MPPRPEGATPPDPDAGPPLVYASAADGGPSALGVAAGGADGLSSDASDDGVDAGGFARAQDEPLLATRRGDSPCPMEAETDEAPLGRLDGSGDESMPTVEPLATPPDQPGDVPMSGGEGVGEAFGVGQDDPPPDASMPDGSGGGGGFGGCDATCWGRSPRGEGPRAEAEGAVLPWP